CVSNTQFGPGVLDACPCQSEEPLGRLNPNDFDGIGLREHGLGECTRATTNIDPSQSRWPGEPLEKPVTNGPAPAPYIALIGIAVRKPNAFATFHHCRLRSWRTIASWPRLHRRELG